MGTANQKSNALSIEDRRRSVALYQRAGLSVREVADQIGCSTTTVQRDRMVLIAELHEIAIDNMGAWRSAKLESYRRKLEQLDAAIGDVDPEAREKIAALVSAWVKVDERESRLIGADAPTKSQVEQVVQPMTPERAQEIIDEMGET